MDAVVALVLEWSMQLLLLLVKRLAEAIGNSEEGEDKGWTDVNEHDEDVGTIEGNEEEEEEERSLGSLRRVV